MSQVSARQPVTPPAKDQRRARKLDRSRTREIRPESTGGVPLPKPTAAHRQSSASHTLPSERTPARRRRPKKSGGAGDTFEASNQQDTQVNPELEALKNRVVGIEDQLKELLLRTPPKVPRRRLRREKTGDRDHDDGARGQVERLGGELDEARRELEGLRQRGTLVEGVDLDDDATQGGLESGIEEIAREQAPAVASPSDRVRAVTLSGRYRVPLPASVSEDNLRAIKRGIASAQNIARTFLDAHPASEVSAEAHAFSSRTNYQRSGSSWSEWFGGYSMSIARFVDKMDIGGEGVGTSTSNAAQSRSPAPRQQIARAATAPVIPRRRPPKLEIRSKAGDAKAARAQSSRRPTTEYASLVA